MSATETAATIIHELDHFQAEFTPQGGPTIFPTQQALLSEPFVGYALLGGQNGNQETFFICRHYTPHLFSPADPTALYGSYLSNHVGRLMAQRPGDVYPFDPTFRLLRKNEFRPKRLDGHWDGIDNRMAWLEDRTVIPSLRQLLAGQTQEIQARKLQVKVQLPDQAILDAIQDEVFRLPFNQRIRLSGAPGTGKTTVLLKRLSQKTKLEFLTEEESALFRPGEWVDGQNWMLFTPSDLLKAYLTEALSKELLPAGDDHVKVYGTFRLETLREMGFIRVGTQGYFRIGAADVQLLKREKGSEHVQLTLKFGEHLQEHWATSYRDALQRFNNETRLPLSQLGDASQKILLQALDLATEAATEDRSEANRRVADYRKLNKDINDLVAIYRQVSGLLEQTENISLRTIYDQARRLQGNLAALTAEDLKVALHPEIPPLVTTLRSEVRELVESLSLRRLFDAIPRAYQDFREQPDTQERYFVPDADQNIRQKTLSAPEQDLLLFHALEFVRALHDVFPNDMSGVPGSIRQVLGRMRIIVAIDEVTDFSSLEIACMERLALPRIGGVTVSGDLMQRVTRQGLKAWEELDALSPGFAAFELNVSYRQTERLFAVAKDLYQYVTGQKPEFRSAYESHPEDPPPIAIKTGKELAVDEWLAARIEEICALHTSHLPTTAVLVPTGADVEELRQQLQIRLEQFGIQVDGSRDGNNLGNASRVRIFPVECIKGLEFEAVFYVGIDRMAEIHKELIDKYVYVGLSRARRFLGVAYERQFPQRLQCIFQHFVNRAAFQANP
jgi:hypothetical protein